MTVKMDKFGRVLIPKAIRKAKGIEPGDELELHTDDERTPYIELRPKARYNPIIDQSGVLPVVTFVDEQGDAAPKCDNWADAVSAAREDRVDNIVESLQ